MSAKGSAYFQTLSCYFIDVRLKLLRQVCFKLNKYKKTEKRELQCSFPPPPPRNLLTSKQVSFCRVKSPHSLKFLNEAD